MSTTKPVWVTTLIQQLKEDPKSLAYAFSTLSSEGNPKVRHVIHRGVTPSNLLLTTTDTRMSKPKHLSHSSTIEIAWWMPNINVQFRITGQAHVVPPTVAALSEEEWGKVVEGLKLNGKAEEHRDWWAEKHTELWESVSGHLRAGFGRPAPGKNLDEVEDASKWPETIPATSEDEAEKKLVDAALSHFAIIAIRPEAVEFLELKPIPNRRTQWARDQSSDPEHGGSWKEVRVAP